MAVRVLQPVASSSHVENAFIASLQQVAVALTSEARLGPISAMESRADLRRTRTRRV